MGATEQKRNFEWNEECGLPSLESNDLNRPSPFLFPEDHESKIPDYEESLNFFHRDFGRFAGGVISRKQKKVILIREEIMGNTLEYPAITISYGDLNTFHLPVALHLSVPLQI